MSARIVGWGAVILTASCVAVLVLSVPAKRAEMGHYGRLRQNYGELYRQWTDGQVLSDDGLTLTLPDDTDLNEAFNGLKRIRSRLRTIRNVRHYTVTAALAVMFVLIFVLIGIQSAKQVPHSWLLRSWLDSQADLREELTTAKIPELGLKPARSWYRNQLLRSVIPLLGQAFIRISIRRR